MKIDVVTSAPRGGDRIRFFVKGSDSLAAIAAGEFCGARNSTVLLREGTARELVVGVGEKMTPESIRQAAGTGIKALLRIGAEAVTIDAGKAGGYVDRIVEGAQLAAYKFEDFREESSRRKNILKALRILVRPADVAEAKREAKRGEIIGEATNRVRALGNQPGNTIYPATLAKRAQEIARTRKLRCKVWEEAALKRDGFGGILAVGQGSANPPRLITLEYFGGRKAEAPIVLVGKAITFDTGGISIKPSDRMDEMKFDKMGGCAVLGIIDAVAALKLPVNVTAVIASAENMPGSRAYRPGDLVTTYDGKTIEVLNTDAEGRIVLADALAYARKHLKPRLVMDFATLTGACLVALGTTRAGLFTLDDALRDIIRTAGEETGDRVWPLPVGEEYEEQIKSDIATAKNTGGREGGASTAASFLKIWAGDVRWAHIDIAGPAWITRELSYLEKGATGFGVRLTLEALRKL